MLEILLEKMGTVLPWSSSFCGYQEWGFSGWSCSNRLVASCASSVSLLYGKVHWRLHWILHSSTLMLLCLYLPFLSEGSSHPWNKMIGFVFVFFFFFPWCYTYLNCDCCLLGQPWKFTLNLHVKVRRPFHWNDGILRCTSFHLYGKTKILLSPFQMY